MVLCFVDFQISNASYVGGCDQYVLLTFTSMIEKDCKLKPIKVQTSAQA